MSGKWEFKKFINAVAYWALIFGAVALLIGYIVSLVKGGSSTIKEILFTIASFLAFAVASVSAFFYARSKRNIAWFIIFIVAAKVVNVMLVLAVVRIL